MLHKAQKRDFTRAPQTALPLALAGRCAGDTGTTQPDSRAGPGERPRFCFQFPSVGVVSSRRAYRFGQETEKCLVNHAVVRRIPLPFSRLEHVPTGGSRSGCGTRLATIRVTGEKRPKKVDAGVYVSRRWIANGSIETGSWSVRWDSRSGGCAVVAGGFGRSPASAAGGAGEGLAWGCTKTLPGVGIANDVARTPLAKPPGIKTVQLE